jgi:hypothetical protein
LTTFQLDCKRTASLWPSIPTTLKKSVIFYSKAIQITNFPSNNLVMKIVWNLVFIRYSFCTQILCLKHVWSMYKSFMKILHPTYMCFMCVLDTWHSCAKFMNIWKMNFTQFPSSNCWMESLWSSCTLIFSILFYLVKHWGLARLQTLL